MQKDERKSLKVATANAETKTEAKSEIGGARAFIGMGSNIEPRFESLRLARNGLRMLGEHSKVSRVYETVPVGGVPQPDYLNAVMEVRTQYGPL